MLFNTFQFAIFFCFVLVLYWGSPPRARSSVLLAASLVFYTLWIPVYLLLLLANLGINYALLRLMVRSGRPRPYLVASVVTTLAMLGYFKYAAMLVESLLPILSAFSIFPEPPELFLPLGISFYSFQIIALSVDTYRGHIEPVKSFSRYALFISFFLQLIAGPILRGYQFLPQLEAGGRWATERTRRGLWLLASGLIKKVIFADFLLAPFVDEAYAVPQAGSGPFFLVATYSFAFQIYFDFSGYTDMARGLACLLGFDIPLNFREPYLSRSPSEFWRRWHITLSRWLQDYLYIPLGGNRRGARRTQLNLLITMLLGGLWHGAAWTFVLWGGLHGILLVFYRGRGETRIDTDARLSLRDGLQILLFFHLTCLLWIFFRAESLSDAILVLGHLFSASYQQPWPLMQAATVAVCAMLHVAERAVRVRLPRIQSRFAESVWGPYVEAIILGSLVAMAITVSGAGGEFIYFQF
jgi:alginate O-acetyltransferase complex protein AlgI